MDCEPRIGLGLSPSSTLSRISRTSGPPRSSWHSATRAGRCTVKQAPLAEGPKVSSAVFRLSATASSPANEVLSACDAPALCRLRTSRLQDSHGFKSFGWLQDYCGLQALQDLRRLSRAASCHQLKTARRDTSRHCRPSGIWQQARRHRVLSALRAPVQCRFK